ncbi:hypothetical protein C9J21_22055, partial [Photobacterium phosphoreum]|uniref:Ig-like domain-containing protein n=1 Tax=Photobacterium phosphoreum TaxID=659 RepID=UPI000D3F1C4A
LSLTVKLKNNQVIMTPSIATITVLPDTISHLTMTITSKSGDKDPILANGKSAYLVKVISQNSIGRPFIDTVIHFSTNDEEHSHLSLVDGKTNAQGEIITEVVDTKAEQLILHTSIPHQSIFIDGILAFAADATTNHIADFTVDKNAATANGTDTVTGTIVIQDKQGNVVPDVQVIAKDVTGASISTPAKTDAQGKTTFTFTNVKSGPDTITVSTAADTTGKTQNVTFAADATTNHIAGFTVDRTTAIANGTDTVTGTIVVQDKQGNVVPDVQVIAKDVTGASISTPAKTDAQGKTTFIFTNVKSGPDTITVSTAADTTGKTQNVTFAADATTNHIAGFTVDRTTATANGTDTVTGTIVIQDKQGNVVPDVQVIAKDVTGASISTLPKTDTQGKTTFTFTNVKSGPDTITVSTAADTTGKTQNVTFAADAATNHVADFTVDKNAATANGTDTVTGTIVIQDKQGNVVPDVQVTAKDVTGASISTLPKTDAQGKTTFTFTNVKSGPDTITVSTAADTTGKTQNVTFAADATTNHIAGFTVDRTTATANGTDTVTGTIVIQDKQGNVVPNVQVIAKDVTGASISTLP